jgi:MoaA/NifB/PqqE/SkfB family radical SAM enzyme
MKDAKLKLKDQVAKQKRQWVRITRACNNDCLFCLDKENQNGGILSLSEIIPVLERGRENKAVRAVISGGEPTLHPDICKIISTAKKIGYTHVQMITNGRMLAYKNFTRRLKAAGLDEVTLSLHSHLKIAFEKLTGVAGGYVQAMTGLRNAQAENFIVSVDIVVSRINYKNLAATLEFFIKHGVSEFDLLYLIPFGGAWENRKALFFSPKEGRECIGKALALAKKNKNLFIWTNRWPAAYLEGFEELIQNPVKLRDEVRGMERGFENFLEHGRPLFCFGSRCGYCFLEDFCRDLAEFKKKGRLFSRETPECLRGKSRQSQKVLELKKGADIYKFLDFYIKYRYFVKGRACAKCPNDPVCSGAHIEKIRKNGFKILGRITK